jgi:hypothetical protein
MIKPISQILISELFPCTTWVCPGLKKSLDDPTLSKIEKLAKIFFQCLYLFPIVFLVADAICSLRFIVSGIYHCLYPNLKTLPADSIPTPPPIKRLPTPLPTSPIITPLIDIQSDLKTDEPPVLALPASSFSPSPPTSPVITPLIDVQSDLMIDEPPVLTPPASPLLSSLPTTSSLIDVQSDSEANRRSQIDKISDSAHLALHRLDPAVNWEDFHSHPNKLTEPHLPITPDFPTPINQITLPTKQPLPLPTDKIRIDDSFFIPQSMGNGIAEYEQTAIGALWTNLQGCFLDSGNPEKGKKYIYSLYATKEHVNKTFPEWKSSLLPTLGGLVTEDRRDFVFYAYHTLNALNQIETDGDIRILYAFIIEHLRNTLQNMPEGEVEPVIADARKVILELCHSKFTGVYLYPFLEDFISKALNARQTAVDVYQLPNQFTSATIAEEIRIANRRLRTAPWRYMQRKTAKEYKKLQGTVGWGFDPTGDSNTPWVHSIQKTVDGKEITVLRHGTPTCDPSLFGLVMREGINLLRQIPLIGDYVWDNETALVIPEYEAHLTAHPEKQTLYVNHQEYDERGSHAVHGEIARSNALRNLEKLHSNFHFLALPLDGPLWSGAYLEKANAEELKKDLHQSLCFQEKGFGLPHALLEKDLLSPKIKEILDQVHDLYFNRQELASIEKKKAFIMLFYSELKDYMKTELKIDFIVSACKDNKDRGLASTLVDMAKNLLKLSLDNDPERLRELFFSALGPFIIKNENIIEERLKLALHVLEHFATLDPMQKQKIREAVPASGFQILEQAVPKEETGPAQMMSSSNFFETINHLKSIEERRICIDANFKEDIHRAYKNGNDWNLAKIESQIRQDLPYIDLQVDGEKIVQYERLFEILGHDLEIFALLHRGVATRILKDPAKQLNGNQINLTIDQPALSKTHISVNSESREIRIKQRLDLTNPARENDHSYPILARAIINGNRDARVSWHFVNA